MSAPLALVREVLSLYERYNPIFSFASLRVDPPIVPYMHQVEFLLRTALRRPLRVFLADEIGLGKTITALVTLKQLEKLGYLKRALIAVPRILIPQWLSEFRRLGLELKVRRIERDTFEHLVREGFPEGYYLASMDLIKRKPYIEKLKEVPWDVIVVDEAHRLGTRPGKETERFKRIGEELAAAFPERHVIFLSATPHRGDPEDYIARLRLLDPYLEAGRHLDNMAFYALTHNVLIFRRGKLDVNEVYEERKIFTDCRLEAIVISATREEVEFHRRLLSFLRTKLLEFYELTGREPRELGLLMATIFKRASSSPYAAIKTLENIIRKRSEILSLRDGRELEVIKGRLEEEAPRLADTIFGLGYDDYWEDDEEEAVDPDAALNRFAGECSIFLSEADVEELKRLLELARAIIEKDSRLASIKQLVKLYVDEGRKVIVFTEYKDTARYVYDALKEVLGDRAVVLLTSDEARDDRRLASIRRRFERDSLCSVMVATDVASEGLNLQVASILINYEPPWSPVKLEQRMGRVWRLGQKSGVIIHTLFLAVDSDRDVLEVLYRKLIALGRAISPKKPLVGEEALVIDMRSESAPLQLKEVIKSGKRVKVTEYSLRTEYLRGGREALNELVELMVRSILKLKEDMRKFNVLPKVSRPALESLLRECAAFTSTAEAFAALKSLLRSTLSYTRRLERGLDFSEEGERLIVIPAGGTPTRVDDLSVALHLMKRLLPQGAAAFSGGTPCIVASGDKDLEIRVYELVIECVGGNSAEVVYKEPIGIVASNGVEVLRGSALIGSLASAIDNLVFIADEQVLEIPEDRRALIGSLVKDVGMRVVELLSKDLLKYRDQLARRGWRRPFDEWHPRGGDFSVKLGRLLGIIRFVSPASIAFEREVDPLTKKRIEMKAMEFAMNYERLQGREPVDVSDVQHFDILSKDPKTGSVRYIEVKGHAGTSLVAELTEEEYRVADEKGDDYWLYIVHDIGAGRPKLVAIRNPVRNMKISVRESRRYILHP